MSNKYNNIINTLILPTQRVVKSKYAVGKAFAPTNIALIKYWGKRDTQLNLPITDSLSLSLDHLNLGTSTKIYINNNYKNNINNKQDNLFLNNNSIDPSTGFYQRVKNFLDLFRFDKNYYYTLEFQQNIPVAAGLASSASGFASIVLALDQLFNWRLPRRYLSILARLGSGSAARSLWNGFVWWHRGQRADGLDSYAEPLSFNWPELKIAILLIDKTEKLISSRLAMQCTQNSLFYAAWPARVKQDLSDLSQAMLSKNFKKFGEIIESNALAMHGCMMTAQPPIIYYYPKTIEAMHEIFKLRTDNIEIFFTQDAGPNIKILFLDKDLSRIKHYFEQRNFNIII